MKDKMRKCDLYLIGVPEGKERKGQMQGEMMTEKLPNMTKGIQEFQWWGFPGGLVVKALPSNEGDKCSIRGQGAKIPHDSWPK